MDELEMKYQKNYDVIMKNPVNFIKTDMINKIKNIQKMQDKIKSLKKSGKKVAE